VIRRGVGPIAVALAALAAVACTSPEAARTRGAGPGTGADVGNRGRVVQMHEGAEPYWKTRRLIEPHGLTDLEPARQAHRLSTEHGAEAR
jgi:hypothetical protein